MVRIEIKGNPGSGKTEIMQIIKKCLDERGINNSCFMGYPPKKLSGDYQFRNLIGAYDDREVQIFEVWGCDNAEDLKKYLADEVRPGQEYHLALKLEEALREHMTNYGGVKYAESAISKIRESVGLEILNRNGADPSLI